MSIRVHIERLVLEGLSLAPRHAVAVQTAVERELGRLLAVAGLSPQLAEDGAVAELPPVHLRVRPRDDPRALGAHIGRSIHEALGGTPHGDAVRSAPGVTARSR